MKMWLKTFSHTSAFFHALFRRIYSRRQSWDFSFSPLAHSWALSMGHFIILVFTQKMWLDIFTSKFCTINKFILCSCIMWVKEWIIFILLHFIITFVFAQLHTEIWIDSNYSNPIEPAIPINPLCSERIGKAAIHPICW